MPRFPSPLVRAAVVTIVAGVAASALVRAANLTERYQAEMQRLRGEWKTEQAALGLAGDRRKLYASYPTPEVTLCTPTQVAPGGTAAVLLPGKFQPKTAFVMENDQVQVTGGAITPKGFTATVSVSAGAVPGFGRLYAYAPVSGAYTRCPVVAIAPVTTYTLTTSNGWTVTLTPEAKAFTVSANEATLAYKAAYAKAGDPKPFETMSGTLQLESDDAPQESVRFSMMAGGLGSAMAEMMALQSKMSDMNAFMKMSEKDRDALMKKLEDLGNRMSKEQEAMVADPAALQRKQDEFGCSSIFLQFSGGSITGSISCGRKLGQLRVTGTR